MPGPVPQFPSGASSGPMPFSMADGTRGVMMMQMSPQSIQITSVSSAGTGGTAQQQPPTTTAAGSGRPQQPMPTNAGAAPGPGAADFFNQLMQGMAVATAQMGASKGLRILFIVKPVPFANLRTAYSSLPCDRRPTIAKFKID